MFLSELIGSNIDTRMVFWNILASFNSCFGHTITITILVTCIESWVIDPWSCYFCTHSHEHCYFDWVVQAALPREVMGITVELSLSETFDRVKFWKVDSASGTEEVQSTKARGGISDNDKQKRSNQVILCWSEMGCNFLKRI